MNKALTKAKTKAPTSNAARVNKCNAEFIKSGGRITTVRLPPDAVEAFETLRKIPEFADGGMSHGIARMLIALSAICQEEA